MHVTIRIACDNAAFKSYPGEEVARILRGTADKLASTLDFEPGYNLPLRDANGNTVGYLEVWESQPTVTGGE